MGGGNSRCRHEEGQKFPLFGEITIKASPPIYNYAQYFSYATLVSYLAFKGLNYLSKRLPHITYVDNLSPKQCSGTVLFYAIPTQYEPWREGERERDLLNVIELDNCKHTGQPKVTKKYF